MFVAVDLSIVVTGLSKGAAGQALRRLPEDIFPAEKFTVRTLPGSGNKDLRLVSFQDAIELIMVLPGKTAKKTRGQFADVIRRHLAGDKSLITEALDNAQSAAPIAQMARASMLADAAPDAPIAIASLLSDDVAPVQYELVLSNKRKLEELEIAKLELDMDAKRADIEAKRADIEAKRADTDSKRAATEADTDAKRADTEAKRAATEAKLVDIEAKKADIKDMQMDRLNKCSTGYLDVYHDSKMDKRAKTVFKDLYLNMAKQEGNPGPVALDDEISEDDVPVVEKLFNLVQVAHGIGIHPKSFAILTPVHTEVMKRYIEVHGQSPLERKHLSMPNPIVDTLYNESDRPMISEIVRSMLG